jgi:hypothetical protein
MPGRFAKIFAGRHKPVIAMAHLPPLPGTPLYDAERGVGGIVDAVRRDLGSGPTSKIGTGNARTPLAKWVLLAAFLPLGFVLRRRNL